MINFLIIIVITSLINYQSSLFASADFSNVHTQKHTHSFNVHFPGKHG